MLIPAAALLTAAMLPPGRLDSIFLASGAIWGLALAGKGSPETARRSRSWRWFRSAAERRNYDRGHVPRNILLGAFIFARIALAVYAFVSGRIQPG